MSRPPAPATGAPPSIGGAGDPDRAVAGRPARPSPERRPRDSAVGPVLLRRRGVRAALVVVGGLLAAASLPPFGFWPLGPIGLAVWFLASENQRSRGRLLLGWLFALGQLGPSLAWATDFTKIGYVVLVPVEAIPFALAGLLVPARRGRSLAFPAAVTLAEAARDRFPFGGLPIGSMVLGQVGGPLLPAARLVGGLGLLALAALAGVGLAHLARSGGRAWRRRAGHLASPPARPALGTLGAGVTALALVVGFAVGGRFAPAGGRPIGSVPVAGVQGGGPRGLRAVLGGQVGVFSRHLRLTETIHPGPSLVLWPEDVVALSGPLAGSPKAAALAAQALRLHATVLAGVTEPVGSTRFLNEVVAWSPSGRIIGRYEKVHRVPFGEYVPDRAFFSHLVSLADVPRDAIPGHGPGFLRTPAGPLGIMISYEVFFSSRSRPAVAAGAEVLLVPTNTASYTTSQIPTQELAASRLRAVEEGRNLVQVSPTGFSAFVSPSGTVSQRSNLGKPALIEATVPLRRGETIFQRLGPHPWLALLGLLLVLGWVLGAVADATAAPGTPAETS